jgi:hypothetical protein
VGVFLVSPLTLDRFPTGRGNERFAGVVQLVEHLLAKQKVVGSRPIARLSSCIFGAVPKWLRERSAKPNSNSQDFSSENQVIDEKKDKKSI